MQVFRAALRHDAADAADVESALPSEFWERYRLRLQHCHACPEKRARLERMLRETCARLYTCAEDARPAAPSSTRWAAEAVLWFDPARIDLGAAREEQRASLLVMHDLGRADSARAICVVVDLGAMTLRRALAGVASVRFVEVVDGVRLWSTLPARVHSVRVIPPASLSRRVWGSVFASARQLLSPKLRERCVSATRAEVLADLENDTDAA